jgi:hypothetical protein
MTREEEKDLENQMREIQRKLKESDTQKKLDTIASHKEYVGKCYKTESTRLSNDGWNDEKFTKYIKIISEVSENEYHVECFEFSLPLFYKFNRKLMKAYDTYPDATIECEPFTFCNEGIFCSISSFKKWTEITQDEFSVAMNECYKQMIDITNKTDLSVVVLDRNEE